MKMNRILVMMAALACVFIVAVFIVAVSSDAHAATHALSTVLPFGDGAFHLASLGIVASAELVGKRAEKIAAFESLVAKMNADGYVDDAADQASYDALKAEVAAFDKKIERAQEATRLKASSAIIVPGQTSPGAKVFAQAKRNSRLKNFRGEGAEERALRFGNFALATIFGNEKAAVWCKENGLILVKAQSEGVNSAGGFLVPEEISLDIIDLRDEYGMFRRLCTPIPMGRDTMTTPRRVGGLTAYPVGEAQAITASQAQWDQVRLTAKKWGVLTLMSSELDEDAAVSIGDILVGEMAYAFAIAEDTAGFAGDGTSTYHGTLGLRTIFNNGVGSLAGAVDAASGHDTFAEIDATDLAKVMGTLPQYCYLRGKPSFYCSQVAWANVFQRLIIGSGGISKDDATGKIIYQYLGFPVEITPSMPTSTGDLSDVAMMLFGDIGLAATMGDRRGMTVARSTEYKFAEDQIAIKATERFDINIHDTGNTTVAGPVVALMGE